MRTKLRNALVLAVFMSSSSWAVLMSPPVNTPGWWVAPPGSATRLQYHSFEANPNSGPASDYTLDGFDPGFLPSPPFPANTKDLWTTGNTSFGTTLTAAGPEYGDGVSAVVSADTTLTKVMGNEPLFPEKTYFYQIVWTTQLYYGGGAQPSNFPQLSVTADGPSAPYTVTGAGGGLAGSNRIDTTPWYVTTWSGTITPQPDYETFSIVFPDASYVDSVWVGTICPEPTVIAFMGAAGVLVLRRGRR